MVQWIDVIWSKWILYCLVSGRFITLDSRSYYSASDFCSADNISHELDNQNYENSGKSVKYDSAKTTRHFWGKEWFDETLLFQCKFVNFLLIELSSCWLYRVNWKFSIFHSIYICHRFLPNPYTIYNSTNQRSQQRFLCQQSTPIFSMIIGYFYFLFSEIWSCQHHFHTTISDVGPSYHASEP